MKRARTVAAAVAAMALTLVPDPVAPLGTDDARADAVSSPDASSWGGGRLDIFARKDNEIYHTAYDSSNGGWAGYWHTLGGSFVSSPGAVSWGPGRIDVFARGEDDAIWHTAATNGAFAGSWHTLGGEFDSGPDASSWAPGRLDIFARRGDQVYHTAYDNGSWAGSWHTIGGSFVSDPAAVSWGPGRIDVFARGQDNAIWHTAYDNGAWAGSWHTLGGSFDSGPDVSSWAPGRLDIFARKGDQIYHTAYDSGNGGWAGYWHTVGGSFRSDPAAVSWGSQRIDIFAQGQDNAMWHTAAVDGAFTGSWHTLGGSFGGGLDPGEVELIELVAVPANVPDDRVDNDNLDTRTYAWTGKYRFRADFPSDAWYVDLRARWYVAHLVKSDGSRGKGINAWFSDGGSHPSFVSCQGAAALYHSVNILGKGRGHNSIVYADSGKKLKPWCKWKAKFDPPDPLPGGESLNRGHLEIGPNSFDGVTDY